MKEMKIVTSIFLVILVVGLASAMWPLNNGISGNVIADTFLDNSYDCRDYDNGTFADIASGVWSVGWISNTIKYDACTGSKKSFYFYDDGNIKKITGRTKIKEYYCDGTSREDEIYDEESLGSGICITETITKGFFGNEAPKKNVKSAKWLSVEPFCLEIKTGTFRDETGKTYKTKCSGKNYIEYSCDKDNQTIVNISTRCGNKCSGKDIGCYGSGSGETDLDTNKDIPGALNVDGKEFLDKCSSNGKGVVQYQCVKNALKSVKTVSCGTNRICIDGDGSGAYCKDLYASADLGGTVANLTGQTGQNLANLGIRVTTLESSVANRNQDILTMLNNCTLQKSGGILNSCNNICSTVSSVCVVSMISDVKLYTNRTISDQELASCDQEIVPGKYVVPGLGEADLSLTCLCC